MTESCRLLHVANHYNKLGIFFLIFVNWNIYLLIICKKRGDYHQSRLLNMPTARVTDKNFHKKLGLYYLFIFVNVT